MVEVSPPTEGRRGTGPLPFMPRLREEREPAGAPIGLFSFSLSPSEHDESQSRKKKKNVWEEERQTAQRCAILMRNGHGKTQIRRGETPKNMFL